MSKESITLVESQSKKSARGIEQKIPISKSSTIMALSTQSTKLFWYAFRLNEEGQEVGKQITLQIDKSPDLSGKYIIKTLKEGVYNIHCTVLDTNDNPLEISDFITIEIIDSEKVAQATRVLDIINSENAAKIASILKSDSPKQKAVLNLAKGQPQNIKAAIFDKYIDFMNKAYEGELPRPLQYLFYFIEFNPIVLPSTILTKLGFAAAKKVGVKDKILQKLKDLSPEVKERIIDLLIEAI